MRGKEGSSGLWIQGDSVLNLILDQVWVHNICWGPGQPGQPGVLWGVENLRGLLEMQ